MAETPAHYGHSRDLCPRATPGYTLWVPFFLVSFICTVWECESYGGVIFTRLCE